MMGKVIRTFWDYDKTLRHTLYSENGLEPGTIYNYNGIDYFILTDEIAAVYGLNTINKYAVGIQLKDIRVFESDIDINHSKVRKIRGNRYEVIQ